MMIPADSLGDAITCLERLAISDPEAAQALERVQRWLAYGTLPTR